MPSGGRFVATDISTMPPQIAHFREKRASDSGLERIMALPETREGLSTIKAFSSALAKKINNSERQLLISENYLRAIETNKNRYFPGGTQKLQQFEEHYEAEMEKLSSCRQDLQNSAKYLKMAINLSSSSDPLYDVGIHMTSSKEDFRTVWVSSKGELPMRINDANRTALAAINKMKSLYSNELQLVARENVVNGFLDLSQFFADP